MSMREEIASVVAEDADDIGKDNAASAANRTVTKLAIQSTTASLCCVNKITDKSSKEMLQGGYVVKC
ncbi:unnamed protein product [Euphydryas editha]|uniref:Uncharacterized protein n=1 Tax=Euphydryas editha TaxID=104508 RepID=A0AAU9UA21_EUPED|nr:unnamed protein product [Euphydryas editha]